jgi:hypothetical protein
MSAEFFSTATDRDIALTARTSLCFRPLRMSTPRIPFSGPPVMSTSPPLFQIRMGIAPEAVREHGSDRFDLVTGNRPQIPVGANIFYHAGGFQTGEPSFTRDICEEKVAWKEGLLYVYVPVRPTLVSFNPWQVLGNASSIKTSRDIFLVPATEFGWHTRATLEGATVLRRVSSRYTPIRSAS